MPRQGAKATVADVLDTRDKGDKGKVSGADSAEQKSDSGTSEDQPADSAATSDESGSGTNASATAKTSEDSKSTTVEAKEGGTKEDKKDGKKHPLTWERAIEIAKLVATVWVAVLGSYVTMQFNERQHELNRIEAIAKMLPHVSSKMTTAEPSYAVNENQGENDMSSGTGGSSVSGDAARGTISAGAESDRQGKRLMPDRAKAGRGQQHRGKTIAAPRVAVTDSGEDMGRDGAIWAIFRTANNRVMLRDLAALFPEDIYRVVSSIAVAGELDHDEDALVALQVTSEKLAAKFSTDPKEAELASRLYEQALRLKERKPDDPRPLHVIDLTTNLIEVPSSDEQLGHLVKSINDLADLHLNDNKDESTSNSGHWQAKDLFKRARQIGLNNKDARVRIQVARADLALAKLYSEEHSLNDSAFFLREAHELEDAVMKHQTADPLKQADSDGDGYASRDELNNCIEILNDRLVQIEKENPFKGVKID